MKCEHAKHNRILECAYFTTITGGGDCGISNKIDCPFNSVNHPSHYNEHPSGVECIDIVEHFNFCIGNAIKYLWRAGLKHENKKHDLEKAKWFIEREIGRVGKDEKTD